MLCKCPWEEPRGQRQEVVWPSEMRRACENMKSTQLSENTSGTAGRLTAAVMPSPGVPRPPLHRLYPDSEGRQSTCGPRGLLTFGFHLWASDDTLTRSWTRWLCPGHVLLGPVSGSGPQREHGVCRGRPAGRHAAGRRPLIARRVREAGARVPDAARVRHPSRRSASLMLSQRRPSSASTPRCWAKGSWAERDRGR